METFKDLPMVLFESDTAWEDWLRANHTQTGGLWLKIAKKASGLASVSYDEAVETALCYGWIDGQKQALDEKFWLQKFTPRRPRSVWSKVNTDRVERLVAAKRMQSAGLSQIEAAKADGRWEAAYHSSSTATVPPDFQAALDANPAAKSFFATLNSSNRYAIYYRIQSLKRPENRAAKIQKFIEMLERGQKPLPLV